MGHPDTTMKSDKIVWANDSPDEDPILVHLREVPSYGKRDETKTEFTMVDLVDMLDQDAENRNNHDFVGTHAVLAYLLNETLGTEAAKKVMLRIGEAGGLDAASGKPATGFSEIKVPKGYWENLPIRTAKDAIRDVIKAVTAPTTFIQPEEDAYVDAFLAVQRVVYPFAKQGSTP